MDDPLTLLNSSPPTKNQYKENVKIIVAAYHEKQLRIKLKNSQSAKYFNTSLLGLSGKLHPIVDFVYTSKQSNTMRPHLKFAVGDYLSQEKIARQGNKSPDCLICDTHEPETYEHITLKCR